ncbi:MAG: hypothetical protein NZL87_05765, partial [Thermomicrobium sp.]|nr:hypothetical protein [Thermomicrobium sp.]
GIELANPMGHYYAFVGTLFARPDPQRDVILYRYHLCCSEIPAANEDGPFDDALANPYFTPPDHPRVTAFVALSSTAPTRFSLPYVERVSSEGTTLQTFRFEVRGDTPQFGADFSDRSRNIWKIWGYGPPDPRRTEPYRLPPLPDGVEASLGPELTGRIFLSTLPANKPGYGFWRRGAELVRVSTHVALTNTMP